MVTDSSPKILIRSPNWVGDAVMATPVPRALKKTMPHCKIHILARDWVAPLWERHPDVDRVIPMRGKGKFGLGAWLSTLIKLRRERYDLAVILPNSFSAAWIAWWAGCRQRVGYSAEQRGWMLTRAVPWKDCCRHLPRPQAYLNLAKAAGADVDLCQEWVFAVKVSSEELARADSLLAKPKSNPSGNWVGLAPGSVAASRRWPAERYAELADRLAALGRPVVLLGSKSDAALADQVIAKSKSKPLSLAGKTSLREMLAVVKRLELLVANDSGAMHTAYSQNIPVLVLQGAADRRVTGPFGANSHVLRDESLECAPCVRNECRLGDLRCMANLSVGQVWEKVQSLLAGKTNAKKDSSVNERE